MTEELGEILEQLGPATAQGARELGRRGGMNKWQLIRLAFVISGMAFSR